MDIFHYQDVDSNALRALEASSRKKILKKIHATESHSQQQYDQVRRTFNSYPIADLYAFEYNESERYKEQDDVIDTVAPNGTTPMSYYTKYSHNAYVFISIITQRPIITLYATFADRVSDILEDSLDGDRTSEQIEEDIRRIISVQIEYATEISEWFTQWDIGESDNVHDDLRLYTWDITTTHQEQLDNNGGPTINNFAEMDEASIRLLTLLGNEKIPSDLVQLVISPTLGSHGTALIKHTCNPVLAKILPLRQTIIEGNKILKSTFDNEEILEAVHSLKTNEDKTLQYLEMLVQKAIDSKDVDHIKDGILRWSVGLDQQDRGRGSNTPSAFQNAFGEPSGSNSKGKKKQEKEKTDTQDGNDPGPSASSSSSAPPDDDDYEPDSGLASRASDMTKEYRETVPQLMNHDHMTRFSTTSESATTVSKAQVRQDDWTFITRTRYGTSRYLVTFTRKSKKPIFSSVPM